MHLRGKVIRFTGVFMLSVCAAALIGGCAGTSQVRDSTGQHASLAKADFRLTEVYVDWRPNPAFQYVVSETTGGNSIGRQVSERARAQASADMQTLIDLFKENASTMVGQALRERGVGAGVKQTINLTPISGFQTGAETQITVRAEVYDSATRKSWKVDLVSSSGVLILGPRNNKPGPEFVVGYSKKLMDTLASADLLN